MVMKVIAGKQAGNSLPSVGGLFSLMICRGHDIILSSIVGKSGGVK